MTLTARSAVSTAAVAALLGLAACENPTATPAAKKTSEGQPQDIAYACAGGETLTARYTDARTVIVTFRGESFTLTLADSASGSRFTGGGREWWIKAFPDREEGTLSPLTATAAAGGPPITTCSRKHPQSGATPVQPPATTPPAATDPSQAAPGAAPTTPGGELPGAVAVTPARAAPCRSGDLVLRRISEEAGAGQRQVSYAFVNQAQGACSLKGFPTLQWLDADGKPLSTVKVIQSEGAMFDTSGPPAEVTLAGGGRAVFHIAFTGIQQGSRACPASAKLHATPPGNSQILEIDDKVQPCTGQIRVGPVRADAGDRV